MPRRCPRRAVGRAPWRATRVPAAITAALALLASAAATPRRSAAQAPAQAPTQASVQDGISRITIPPGRALPVSFPAAVTRAFVADTAIADLAVITDREIVLNGKQTGQTDILIWVGGQVRRYRVAVSSPSDRPQVVLAIKFAEVRRDALTQFGASVLGRGANGRAGTGLLKTDNQVNPQTGAVTLPNEVRFLTVLSNLGARDVLAFIEAEETRGNARTLAEPTLMAADREQASFLAGGEVPIPIAQPGTNGQTFVTISYREFGVRLQFSPEVLSDSLIKLRVRPEVSSLDYANAVVLSGFRVPALRSRRLESTIDVRADQSLIISGLFSDERERVRTGVPFLMNVPVLGSLFSSTRWQRAETELLVIVTPTIIDPSNPRPADVLRLEPDPRLPARDALQPRLSPADTLTRPAERRP